MKDDMDKFEQQEMKKIRPIKKTWCDWLINTNIPKQTMLRGEKDIIDGIIKDIYAPF